jgi:putative Holliday junction resolvase
MALDIGSKRIGVALSDPLGITSQPYVTIEYKSRKEAFQKIAEIILEKEVDKVIAGLPVNLAGDFTLKSRETESFIRKLENFLKKDITRVDERWTSQEAEKHMRNLGKKPSRNKADIDRLAAAIMLREYMNEQG